MATKQTDALFENVSNSDVAEVVKFYQENPVKAAEDIFGFEFGLPWHQRMALNISWEKSDVIWVFSRGAGKSWMLALFSALSAILYPEEKIGIFGPSFRQSKFVWMELEKLYDRSKIFQELCKKKPMIQSDVCDLRLTNGSIINALPLGDGSRIRGARYYRIIVDELAQVPEDILDIVIGGMRATTKDPMEAVVTMRRQRELIAEGKIKEANMIMPKTNKLLMASTAYYAFNHLYRRVQLFKQDVESSPEKHPVIKVPDKIYWNDDRAVLMFDKDDPPEGFMNQKSIDEMSKKLSKSKFDMEYYCFFPSDSQGFFKRSKIEDSKSSGQFTVELQGDPNFNYVLGVDVARKSDNFSIAIGKIDGSVLRLVRVITLNSKSFPAMHDLLRRVISEYKVVYICMDAGGGGTALEDQLKDPRMCPPGQKLIFDPGEDPDAIEQDGLHILKMIKFSDDNIPTMAHQLQADIDHNRFLFPSQPSICSQGVVEKNAFSLEQLEESYLEIDQAVEETTSIVAQATRTGKLHLGLPGEISTAHKSTDQEGFTAARKDRWTSIMLMNWAHFLSVRTDFQFEPELATGFALDLSNI